MATVALDSFVTKCERQRKRQSDEFEELMGGFSEEDRPKFLGEIRTYEVRLEALGLVLTTNNAGEEKLKQFIGRFASAHHGETEGAAVAALELGQGPPCESYLQLRQLRPSLEALIDKFHTCAQPKMLKGSLCVQNPNQPVLPGLNQQEHPFTGLQSVSQSVAYFASLSLGG